MNIKLFSDTKILADHQPLPVLLAAADLARDLKKTCLLSSDEGRRRGKPGYAAGYALRKAGRRRNATGFMWRGSG